MTRTIIIVISTQTKNRHSKIVKYVILNLKIVLNRYLYIYNSNYKHKTKKPKNPTNKTKNKQKTNKNKTKKTTNYINKSQRLNFKNRVILIIQSIQLLVYSIISHFNHKTFNKPFNKIF